MKSFAKIRKNAKFLKTIRKNIQKPFEKNAKFRNKFEKFEKMKNLEKTFRKNATFRKWQIRPLIVFKEFVVRVLGIKLFQM